jgi:hypothetical protein
MTDANQIDVILVHKSVSEPVPKCSSKRNATAGDQLMMDCVTKLKARVKDLDEPAIKSLVQRKDIWRSYNCVMTTKNIFTKCARS